MSSRRTYALVAAIAALIAGVLIAVSTLGSEDEQTTPSGTLAGGDTAALLAGIPQSGPALGRPDAPVTVVEFADIQCPFCGQWSQSAFPDIVREYVRTGQVRLVYRGLAFIGPDSVRARRFALAAGLQDKLWHAVDLLYANQGQEGSGWVTDELLADVGAAIPSFDLEQSLEDESSPEVEAEITAAEDAAAELDIESTPTFAAGRTGGELRVISLTGLDAAALRPTVRSLLGR